MVARTFMISEYTQGFKLSGPIDENSDFSPITESKKDSFELHLGGTTRINSYGIRKWIMMLNKVENKDITYVNCPVYFVNQVNLVNKLVDKVKINTLFLPFYCSQCDEEPEFLINFSELLKDNFRETLATDYKCPTCKENCEFYDDIEEYLSFLDPEPEQ